jgi:two-component system alkaline phosphatase synthesis response regulator PhoP
MAKQKMLVVDDEEDIPELLRFKLSKQNYQFTFAASGEDVLRCAQSETPDLIVLALMLLRVG